MKKVIAILSFLFIGISTFAQGWGADPEAMKERTKERIKAPLMEQAKLTEKQADAVIDIYFDAQLATMKLRRDETMDDEAKKAKVKEINTQRDQKIKDIPLTEEQQKAVVSFYEEQRKRMQERGGPRGDRN